MTLPNDIEKRRFPRINLNVDIQYRILNSSESQILKSQAKNISAGGICLISLDKPETGNILDLSFILPGLEGTLRILGRVAWVEAFIIGDTPTSKGYEAGIEFIDIKDEEQQKINRYVLTLLK